MIVTEIQTKKKQQKTVTHEHMHPRQDKHQLQSYAMQTISLHSGRWPRHIRKLAPSKGMIGRVLPSNQLAVRKLSDTVVSSVSTSLGEIFGQKEPQPSVTRCPAQQTHTVYQPSSVRHSDIFSAKTSSLPPQATGRSLWFKTLSHAQYAPEMDFSTCYPAI